MTQAELLAAVRRRLRDVAGDSSEYLWTDAELIDEYGNEARNRMFNLCRYLLIDSTTATDSESSPLPLCRLSLVANTGSYSLSTKIIELLDVQTATGTYPLKPIRRDELPSVYDNWRTLDAGTPEYYCTDLETDKIFFFPTPSANDTAYLTVTRHPLTLLDYDASPAPSLGFRSEYHNDLIPGIMALAFQKKDAQTDKPQLAAEHEARFIARCDRIRIELERRLHGGRVPVSDTRLI